MNDPTSTERPREPNRLAREKSPYLLQHARNPVDWYAWGDEAFERARREDKPIFLSIGYSTCHWCHVMERESFESEAIAALLAESFIAVKVDREERPDVDRVYMTAMQAMGAGGGWPLNVFLTPELKPFWGGTYFPPRSVPGRVGMTELLPQIATAYREQRERIERTGDRVFEALDALARPEAAAEPHTTLMHECATWLARQHDDACGGFGGAPKFPSTANLAFLLRWWARAPRERAAAREQVLRQLDAMIAGGIHDHLGGGFHRYSTDREWLVPHFEKMLYDQALIADALIEAFLASGDARYAQAARGIFAYVARDLTSPEGAFYSAEDADSEGEEGRFHVWTPAQIAAVLEPDEAALFSARYGVTPGGNFEHGSSILHDARSTAALATSLGRSEADVAASLAAASRALLAARERRVRPHRDDKVLTGWNGLMVAALARASRALHEPELAERAVRAASFVWERMWDAATRTLLRRWRDGDAAGAGQLDDHAYFARGCLELYGATHDPIWLERAVAVTESQIDRFADDAQGGFWESPPGDPHVRVRMKDGFDGAELAGNSVAALNLLRLAALLDRADWRARAAGTLDAFARRLAGNPWAMPMMLCAMDLAAGPLRHVVVVGEPDDTATRALLDRFDGAFRPLDERLLVHHAAREALARLAPFAASLSAESGRATGYVCVDYACNLPVHDPDAFAALLDEPAAAAR